MSDQEIAPQTAELAVTPTESAPVETVETPAENVVESAPTENAVPKHIEELKAQRKKRQEAEKEAAYWRGVAEAGGRTQPQQPVQEAQPQPTVEPRLEDFENYDDWAAANTQYIAHVTEQRLLQRMQEQQRKQQEAMVQHTFKEKIVAEQAADPYIWDTVTEVGNMVNQAVADLVVRSDTPVALLRHLQNNPAEARRLSALPPLLAAKELGVLEARISAAPKPQPPKTVTMAPEPIKTVNPVGNADPDPETLPIEEWMKRFGGPTKRR